MLEVVAPRQRLRTSAISGIFRLAHLSDPHLPLPVPALRHLTLKQVMARASWRRKRGRTHGGRTLELLLGDIRGMQPDHLVVTGDITNLGSKGESLAAIPWLEALGSPDAVSLVPGNHDRLVPAADAGCRDWQRWTTGDDGRAGWPFRRDRGPVALIGLDSAVATPPGMASGRVGERQIDALEVMLSAAGRAGMFRAVLIHHPPILGPGGHRKALTDRAALAACLQRSGAELVLHGHHHAGRLRFLQGPHGVTTVSGVPSASAGAGAREAAGWHLHSIARRPGGWWIATEARRVDHEAGAMRVAGRWEMFLPSAAAGDLAAGAHAAATASAAKAPETPPALPFPAAPGAQPAS
ncbi:metallophosphoesterase family protein [Rhizosaccharibacter radicis]|uniref:Metallophosphoesterase n=1 Tax=Rhizosaccharibacter radicis TaxID=2782605 RepID=A0ABT1VV19_9PROT|nr:metallophosphoesterase [Acetobacteraceae bacterium KSS12]